MIADADTWPLMFESEMRSMLFAAGDCEHPNGECVAVVCTIVHQHLTAIVSNGQQLATQLGHAELELRHVLYQLRKHRMLLHRLTTYMRVWEAGSKALVAAGAAMSENNVVDVGVDEQEDLETAGTSQTTTTLSTTKSRRLSSILEALESFDVTGELSAFVVLDIGVDDEVKNKRWGKLRAAHFVESLSSEEYTQYTNARGVSFWPKSGVAGGARTNSINRFKDWVFGEGSPCADGPQPTDFCLEVLAFVAKEIRSCLLDVALTIRDETTLPYAMLTGHCTLPPSQPAQPRVQQVAVAPATKAKTPLKPGAKDQTSKVLLTNGYRPKPPSLQSWHVREALRRLQFASDRFALCTDTRFKDYSTICLT